MTSRSARSTTSACRPPAARPACPGPAGCAGRGISAARCGRQVDLDRRRVEPRRRAPPDQVVHLQRGPHRPAHPDPAGRQRLAPACRRDEHAERALRPAEQPVEVGPVGLALPPSRSEWRERARRRRRSSPRPAARTGGRSGAAAARPRRRRPRRRSSRRPTAGRGQAAGRCAAEHRPGRRAPACRRRPRRPTRPAAWCHTPASRPVSTSRSSRAGGAPQSSLVPAPRGTTARSCVGREPQTAATSPRRCREPPRSGPATPATVSAGAGRPGEAGPADRRQPSRHVGPPSRHVANRTHVRMTRNAARPHAPAGNVAA